MPLLLAALVLAGVHVSQMRTMSIIPKPVSVQLSDGNFTLNATTSITAPASLGKLAKRLQSYLAPATGFPFPLVKDGASNTISLKLDKSFASLGSEGYRLSVSRDRVDIQSSTQAGVFYGVQSLRQMLPNEVFNSSQVSGVEWNVPCSTIEDQPRFTWRGLHLDVGRHFMPKEFVLKYIDLLALHKMNTLHFHLTEDQGWRIEIKKYPKLTSVGAWRKETMAGHYEEHRYDGTPHGGFYTQKEIKEIVKYAQDRFVTVVPEIEMPGHAQAAIAAYPELGNTGKQLEVGTHWGVYENVYNVEDKTIQFQKDVLTEVLALFPSKFIHIGGDECPKEQWKASPQAQAKIKALGLKDENELQSWFIHQIDAFLAAKGRRLIGWDEILEGGLAPGAAVMSWRGEEGGIASAKAGHDVVMTPGSHTYFDHYQSQDHKAEGLAIGGFLPLDKVYSYEPIPHQLNSEEAKHVLGAQGQLWTEYIPTPSRVEYMAYPRACALAEVLWTPKEEKNYPDFIGRLRVHVDRLSKLNVNYRKLDPKP